MPLVRYIVRNEYGLGNPTLYDSAYRDDPKAVLEGVAMAGLVGVLRQLGDLAEFAAEIFQDLHKEFTAAAARGNRLALRIQKFETDFLEKERALLSQTRYINYTYMAGTDWHPNLQTDQNVFTRENTPKFILDSYQSCRCPPQLFLLDKFDTAGIGACMNRYSNPSFFKKSFDFLMASEPQAHTKKKIHKTKIRRLHLEKEKADTSGGLMMPKENSKLQYTVSKETHSHIPANQTKLKRKPTTFFNTSIKRSYMKCVLECSFSDSDDVIDELENHFPLGAYSNESDTEFHEIISDSQSSNSAYKERTNESNGGDSAEGSVRSAYKEEDNELLADDDGKAEESSEDYTSDDFLSDTENYVDTSKSLESENEFDSECRAVSKFDSMSTESQGVESDVHEGKHDLTFQLSTKTLDGNHFPKERRYGLINGGLLENVAIEQLSRTNADQGLSNSTATETQNMTCAMQHESVEIVQVESCKGQLTMWELNNLPFFKVESSEEPLKHSNDGVGELSDSTDINCDIECSPSRGIFMESIADQSHKNIEPVVADDLYQTSDDVCLENLSDGSYRDSPSLLSECHEGDGSNKKNSKTLIQPPMCKDDNLFDVSSSSLVAAKNDTPCNKNVESLRNCESGYHVTETEAEILRIKKLESENLSKGELNQICCSVVPLEVPPFYSAKDAISAVPGACSSKITDDTTDNSVRTRRRSKVSFSAVPNTWVDVPPLERLAMCFSSIAQNNMRGDNDTEHMSVFDSQRSNSHKTSMKGEIASRDSDPFWQEPDSGESAHVKYKMGLTSTRSSGSVNFQENEDDAGLCARDLKSENESIVPPLRSRHNSDAKHSKERNIICSNLSAEDVSVSAIDQHHRNVTEVPGSNNDYSGPLISETVKSAQTVSGIENLQHYDLLHSELLEVLNNNKESTKLSSEVQQTMDSCTASRHTSHDTLNQDVKGDTAGNSDVFCDKPLLLEEQYNSLLIHNDFDPGRPLSDASISNKIDSQESVRSLVNQPLTLSLPLPLFELPVVKRTPGKSSDSWDDESVSSITLPADNALQSNTEGASLPPVSPLQWRLAKPHFSSQSPFVVAPNLPFLSKQLSGPVVGHSHEFSEAVEEKYDTVKPLEQTLLSNDKTSQNICSSPGEKTAEENLPSNVQVLEVITMQPPLSPAKLVMEADVMEVPSSNKENMDRSCKSEMTPSRVEGEMLRTLLSSVSSSMNSEEIESQDVSCKGFLQRQNQLGPLLNPSETTSLASIKLEEVLISPSNLSLPLDDEKSHVDSSALSNYNGQDCHQNLGGETQSYSLSEPLSAVIDVIKVVAVRHSPVPPPPPPIHANGANVKLLSNLSRPRDPLVEAVASHDKTKMKKVFLDSETTVTTKLDSRSSMLEQIRNKSFNLKPAAAPKPNIKGPVTNLRLAAILEKASTIRQAYAGSDEDDDDDSDW